MKKIFFILFTLVAFISYGQSVLTDVNGKVITSATGDILVQEADPNNFEYTPNAEWIPVNGVANNEIWILAFNIGDRYSSFTCTVGGSGDYAMDIIGGADGKTLLQTIDTASGKPINFQIPATGGKWYSSEGYYTFKLRIYAVNPANNILTFTVSKHPLTTTTYNGWKIINFGTVYLTDLSLYARNSNNIYLVYANTYYCSNIVGIYSFYSCTELKQVTMAKYMNIITKLYTGSIASYSSSGGSFGGCTSLEKITMPIEMNKLEYLGGLSDNCYNLSVGAFSRCTSLKTLKLPDNLPKLKTLGINAQYIYCGGFVQGCESLTAIYGLKYAPLVTESKNMITGCRSLTTIPNTLYSTPGMMFSSSSLKNMVTFQQDSLRASSFTLTGTSSVNRSNITSILINWSKSNFTGNVDIRYNSLPDTEINRIFTALPTTALGLTIYVGSNVGSATCDPTIATAKGWTVVTS